MRRNMVDSYKKWLTDLGYSDKTIKNRLSDIRNYLKNHKYLTEINYIKYLNSLNRKYNPRTISRKASTLRSFAEFKGIALPRHIQGMHNKQNRDLSKIHIIDQRSYMNCYYGIVDDLPDNFENLRLKIIIIMLAHGIRKIGIQNILMDGVDLEKEELRFRSKFNKHRTVPILFDTKVFEKYLHLRHKLEYVLDKSHLLVYEYKGIYKALQDREFYKLYYSATEKLLGKKVNPHSWRHTMATHLLEAGTDIRVVQEILGHSNISSTQLYSQNT